MKKHEHVIKHGSIRMDLLNRRVYVRKLEVFLKYREFETLKELVVCNGYPCPREKLGKKGDGKRTVDVYVSRLRSLIGAKRIETVAHYGYRLRTL